MEDPWANAPPSPRPPSEAAATTAPHAETETTVPAASSSKLATEVITADPDIPDPPSATETSNGHLDNDEATGSGSASEPAKAVEDVSEEARVEEGDAIEAGVESGAGGGDDFDDFDDFDQAPDSGAVGTTVETGDDDGFGDFGDFEAGDEVVGGALVESPTNVVPPLPVEAFRALSLRPVPPRGEILAQVIDILQPLTAESSGDGELTDEPPRMTGGLGQVMPAESSRDVYAQLTTAPMLKPLDWTRSRSRREHLISMGVPVNLDEVESHRLSALPPLRITTMPPPPVPLRPASIDGASFKGKLKLRDSSPVAGPVSAGPRVSMSMSAAAGGASTAGAAGGVGKSTEARHGLGVKPDFEMDKAEELCGMEEDQLSLLPLARLQAIQEQLASISAQASAQLAWYLQLKDAQLHDSATYNGMISELISNAAKAKTAQAATGGGVFRRASTKARPVSVSGSSTPRRVGSPGTFQ